MPDSISTARKDSLSSSTAVNMKMRLKSREDSRVRHLNSWSLNGGKPEPSVEEYLVNIDGTVSKRGKGSIEAKSSQNANKVQTKKKLT